MNNSQRVLVNTLAQYIRVFISMFLSLYTIRIVLKALGADDFGIYSLVAGVVSMLAFVTNALVQTTQRFVSYYQGQGNVQKIKEVFCTSLIIHIVLGLVVVMLLEVLTPFIFDGLLFISPDRINAASTVYQTVVGMLFITFITSPFRALLVSHENIVYISIIDIFDVVLKLLFAILLVYVPMDKLVFYGITMLLVQAFNLVALSLYCARHYVECVFPRKSMLHVSYVKDLVTFAGWNIYSTACIVGRQQGVAIVVNRILGTVANAAYGIGFQLAGYTNFLSASLVNAVRPQIMKAEGAGDRQKALWLSNVISKFSFFLLSAICVPCIFEMDAILKIWLGSAPDGANIFCIMVLTTIVVDAVTGGLGHINQAVGNIKWYSILMNTPKLISIPIMWIILKYNGSLPLAAASFVVVEALCTWIRVPFVSKTTGLSITLFIKEVVYKEIGPFLILLASCFLCVHFILIPFRFLLTFIIAVVAYFISIWFLGLTNQEKNILSAIILTIVNKFKSK